MVLWLVREFLINLTEEKHLDLYEKETQEIIRMSKQQIQGNKDVDYIFIHDPGYTK